MVITHNMASIAANRSLGLNSESIQKNMEKLSSGMKINRASDDAAGLSVSEKMRSQIRGLNQASRNVGDMASFVSTTEGYLQETTDILQRIRELAVQASNGVYSDEDRAQIQVEVSQLVSEVDRIASSAQFNGMNMLTGRFAENGIKFHIGANVDQNIQVSVGNMSAQALELRGTQEGGEAITVTDQESSNMTIATIDEALKVVLRQRSDLGAVMNRAEQAQKGIDIAAENLQASESRIRDTDYSAEMVSYTKNAILQQAGTAMLAQANNSSQNVLALLR